MEFYVIVYIYCIDLSAEGKIIGMLLNDGNELQFWIDSVAYDENNALYLNHIDNDSRGMKFSGGFPFLWEYDEENVLGPNIYDENDVYRVTAVDYPNNNIWLEKI